MFKPKFQIFFFDVLVINFIYFSEKITIDRGNEYCYTLKVITNDSIINFCIKNKRRGLWVRTVRSGGASEFF
jgi:hypothetical protein